jgi:hypothetical protein
MKHLILILALVAFVTGSYASNVFAAAPDVNCVDCLDHENEGADEQCNDCECHHSHVIGFVLNNTSKYLAVSDLASLEPTNNLFSNALSSLYRPPIA